MQICHGCVSNIVEKEVITANNRLFYRTFILYIQFVLFITILTTICSGCSGSASAEPPSPTPSFQKQSVEFSENNVILRTPLDVLGNLSSWAPREIFYTHKDAVDIAKVLKTECGSVQSTTEQACVAWTVLNRVDKYDSTISSVLRAPHQFAFYENTAVSEELLDLAYDVLWRWNAEKNGEIDSGRVLPKDFLYFVGYGGHNHFRKGWRDGSDDWNYQLDSPYID